MSLYITVYKSNSNEKIAKFLLTSSWWSLTSWSSTDSIVASLRKVYILALIFLAINQSVNESQGLKTHLSIGSVESWSLSTAHCFFSAWSFLAFWSAIFCLKYLFSLWKIFTSRFQKRISIFWWQNLYGLICCQHKKRVTIIFGLQHPLLTLLYPHPDVPQLTLNPRLLQNCIWKQYLKWYFLEQLNLFVLDSHSNYSKFKRVIKRLIWLIPLIWPEGKDRWITWFIPVQLIGQLKGRVSSGDGYG